MVELCSGTWTACSSNTAPFHCQAWRELFASSGQGPERSRSSVAPSACATTTSCATSSARCRRSACGSWADRKEELFRAAIGDRVRPLPGAVALVRRLQENGREEAVVSSAPRLNVETLLEALGIADAFDALVAEEDAERGKPDPQGYLVAAERLGVAPDAVRRHRGRAGRRRSGEARGHAMHRAGGGTQAGRAGEGGPRRRKPGGRCGILVS